VLKYDYNYLHQQKQNVLKYDYNYLHQQKKKCVKIFTCPVCWCVHCVVIRWRFHLITTQSYRSKLVGVKIEIITIFVYFVGFIWRLYLSFHMLVKLQLPLPVSERSRAMVCRLSLAAIAGLRIFVLCFILRIKGKI
jgi:hypothetical protein